MTELETYVYRGSILILGGISAYLLKREFNRKDQLAADIQTLANKVTISIESLNKATAELSLAIHEIRLWSTERFVSKPDHERDIEALEKSIDAFSDRCEHDRERCEARCPERCASLNDE